MATQSSSRGTRRKVSVVSGQALSDTETRQRVIDAAIDAILEQSLYRASSNVIAERAGITWGVIQYYFGTREGLMVAVLEEGNRRLLDLLTATTISGEDLEHRLKHFIDVVSDHYASPAYLAFVQVLINLSHDPKTSQKTRDGLAEMELSAGPEIHRLLREVFRGSEVRSARARESVFHLARGLAVSQVMLPAVAGAQAPTTRQSQQMRAILAEGLAAALTG